MKRLDLIDKIPKPLTTSHVGKSTLRLYNYKIVDFLLQHGFDEEWFDEDDETKWNMVNDLE